MYCRRRRYPLSFDPFKCITKNYITVRRICQYLNFNYASYVLKYTSLSLFVFDIACNLHLRVVLKTEKALVFTKNTQ